MAESTALILTAGHGGAAVYGSGQAPPSGPGFTPPPAVETLPAKNVGPTSATLEAKIQPKGSLTVYQFEWGTDETYGNLHPATPVQAGSGKAIIFVSQSLGAGDPPLTPETEYHYRVVASNAGGTTVGADESFTTDPDPGPSGSAPSVSTSAATLVGFQDATLHGTVTPNGQETDAWFEHRKLGSSVWIANKAVALGAGTAPVDIDLDLDGLPLAAAGAVKGDTYEFRAVASSVHAPLGVVGQVREFELVTREPLPIAEAATNVQQTSALLNGTVNPQGLQTNAHFIYGELAAGTFPFASAVVVLPPGTTARPVKIPIDGLTPGVTYAFKLVAANPKGTVTGVLPSGVTPEFTTQGAAGQAPDVDATGATLVGPDSAALNGLLHPHGLATTAYAEISSDGGANWIGPYNVAGGASFNHNLKIGIAVTLGPGQLTPSTAYKYRFVATNSAGSTTSNEASFTTTGSIGPPTVTTQAATLVLSASATLNGLIHPNGAETTWLFEYGLTTAYGSTTAGGTVGSGAGSTAVADAISSLLPNKRYHFRLKGTNSQGEVLGADLTFETPGAPVVTVGTPTKTHDTAILKGTVDPNLLATEYHFAWNGGAEERFPNSTPSAFIAAGIGTAQSVEAQITGLTPDTLYIWQLVARNAVGLHIVDGAPFTTESEPGADPPTCNILPPPAGGVLSNAITARVEVNPNGLSTTVEFEYRKQGAASWTPGPGGAIACGSGSAAVIKSDVLAGLLPSTVYEYRATATSSAGSTTSGIFVQQTLGAGGQNPTLPPLGLGDTVTWVEMQAPTWAQIGAGGEWMLSACIPVVPGDLTHNWRIASFIESGKAEANLSSPVVLQREVVKRDAQGNPLIVEIIGKMPAVPISVTTNLNGTKFRVETTASSPPADMALPAGFDPFGAPGSLVPVEMTMRMPSGQSPASKDDDQVADINTAANAVAMKTGPYCRVYRTFTQFENAGATQATLYVHAYWTFFAAGPVKALCDLRVSNSYCDKTATSLASLGGTLGHIHFVDIALQAPSPGGTAWGVTTDFLRPLSMKIDTLARKLWIVTEPGPGYHPSSGCHVWAKGWSLRRRLAFYAASGGNVNNAQAECDFARMAVVRPDPDPAQIKNRRAWWTVGAYSTSAVRTGFIPNTITVGGKTGFAAFNQQALSSGLGTLRNNIINSNGTQQTTWNNVSGVNANPGGQGPWYCAGVKGGGTTSTSGVRPYEAYDFTIGHIRYQALTNETEWARQAIALYDTDGLPITLEKLDKGAQHFQNIWNYGGSDLIFVLRHKTTQPPLQSVPYWNTPGSYGLCVYATSVVPGTGGTVWSNTDFQHNVRFWRGTMVMVEQANDPMAKEDMRLIADIHRIAVKPGWTQDSTAGVHVGTGGVAGGGLGWAGDAGGASSNPGQTSSIWDRAGAWGGSPILLYYSYADDTWRSNATTLRIFRDYADASILARGLIGHNQSQQLTKSPATVNVNSPNLGNQDGPVCPVAQNNILRWRGFVLTEVEFSMGFAFGVAQLVFQGTGATGSSHGLVDSQRYTGLHETIYKTTGLGPAVSQANQVYPAESGASHGVYFTHGGPCYGGQPGPGLPWQVWKYQAVKRADSGSYPPDKVWVPSYDLGFYPPTYLPSNVTTPPGPFINGLCGDDLMYGVSDQLNAAQALALAAYSAVLAGKYPALDTNNPAMLRFKDFIDGSAKTAGMKSPSATPTARVQACWAEKQMNMGTAVTSVETGVVWMALVRNLYDFWS